MILCFFAANIWINFGLVKCHDMPDILPTLLEEFNIYQPILFCDSKVEMDKMTKAVKALNYWGYSIGVSQKGKTQYNPYQSHVVFTDVPTQFKWHSATYAPILVVSRIETEEDLKEVDVSIGSEVLFLDWDSLKVYESYTINNNKISRYLGQFQANSTDKKKFMPSKDHHFNMEARRGNFHGLQLMGAVSLMSGDPEKYSNLVQFFPNNMTYDITKLANYPEYNGELHFWNILEVKILKIMESKFNFTSNLFIRKDMKLGSPYVSSNGSTVIGEGLFQNLVEGSTDFVIGAFTMLPIRLQFFDFLPTTRSDSDAIFVPIEDTYEEIDWNVYLQPLASEVWIVIIIKCIIFSILAFIVEWFHDYKMVSICHTLIHS